MTIIIGLVTNYSELSTIGETTYLGVADQEWNLLAQDYITSIEAAGAVPIILPVTEHPDTLLPFLSQLDGVVFTGGQDVHPSFYHQDAKRGFGQACYKRDVHEFNLFKKIYEQMDIPILGVCRGMQVMNVALGGTLIQDINSEMKNILQHNVDNSKKDVIAHKVNINKDSFLYNWLQTTELGVNSYHHQVIDKTASSLTVVARSKDQIIEAVEHKESERYVGGVQWHPEMMQSHEKMRHLFNGFIQECRKNKK